jgi:tetraacyldisaccharide 4'-kinase
VGKEVFAFAGIGRPAKFFDTLRACGAVLAQTRGFPDHHPFTPGEVTALLDAAERARLLPVTTEKDAVRLAALALAEPRVAAIMALPVRLALSERDRVEAFVLERCSDRH